jgi:hypothetical protein
MKRILLLTAAACALSTSAFAEETLELHQTTHATFVEAQQAGANLLTLTRFEGQVTLPGGTGQFDFHATAAAANGVGVVEPVYMTVTMPDGSALSLRAHLDAKLTPTGGQFEGPVTVIDGKGKWAGATGYGTFSAVRTGALKVGAAAEGDIVLTLTTGKEAGAAKAMLTKAVAAIKADRDVALGNFNKGEAGFRQGDEESAPFGTTAIRAAQAKKGRPGRLQFQRPDLGAQSRMSIQERVPRHRSGLRDRAGAYRLVAGL